MAFTVSIEKSDVILIGLPSYVTCCFSFVDLNILSLFCMFSVLIITCDHDFFYPLSLVFCKLFLLLLQPQPRLKPRKSQRNHMRI